MIQRASEGDHAAVEELLERYLPQLRAHIRGQAGALVAAREESGDLLQSVCRELLERLADDRFEFRGEAAFREWLYRAARLKLMNRHRHWLATKRDAARDRRQSSASGFAANGFADELPTPSEYAALNEELARFNTALAQLPERDQEVVRLAHFEGLSHREIAQRLGVTENHSRQILHRALVQLSKPS